MSRPLISKTRSIEFNGTFLRKPTGYDQERPVALSNVPFYWYGQDSAEQEGSKDKMSHFVVRVKYELQI